MIKLMIVGHVGFAILQNAEKSPVLTICVASHRRVREKDITDWVTLKVWGERGTQLSTHVKPGQRLLARGRPEVRLFQKTTDSPWLSELCLHVATLEFVGPKPSLDETPRLPRPSKRQTAVSEK
jgi:single-stranded DNA-binding protein